MMSKLSRTLETKRICFMDPSLIEQLHIILDQIKAQADMWNAKEETAKKSCEEMARWMKQNEEALDSKIVFDVSGTLFSTTKETLLRVKDSYFSSMLSGNWKPQKDGTYYIDRSPRCFGLILDYMRYGVLETDGLTPTLKNMLQVDFDYFFPNDKVNDKVLSHNRVNLCSDYMEALKSWLGKSFDASKLLWRGSRDGFTPQAFHDRCDNQGPTLTVIESSEGWIFGGFNPIDWVPLGYLRKPTTSFLFTLKNPHGIPPTQYFCNNNQKSSTSYHLSKSGPIFGNSKGYDLAVNYLGERSVANLGYGCYVDTTGFGGATFTGTGGLFELKEIEVFAIS